MFRLRFWVQEIDLSIFSYFCSKIEWFATHQLRKWNISVLIDVGTWWLYVRCHFLIWDQWFLCDDVSMFRNVVTIWRFSSNMAGHGCKYSADSFCYVCGGFFSKQAKKHRLDSCVRAKEAYRAYFGMAIGDQDKHWAPHVICDYCRRTLEGWFRGQCVSLFPGSGVSLQIISRTATFVWWIQLNEERERMRLI